MPADDVASLLESWKTHLQAERKSPHTIRTYTNGVEAYLRWHVTERLSVTSGGRVTKTDSVTFDRASVEAFTASLLDNGAEPATALSRQRGVRRFSSWLAAEREIERDELAGMRPPKLDDKMPAELTAEQVRAILGTCGAKEFHDIREPAIIRVMTEGMVR